MLQMLLSAFCQCSLSNVWISTSSSTCIYGKMVLWTHLVFSALFISLKGEMQHQDGSDSPVESQKAALGIVLGHSPSQSLELLHPSLNT